MHRFRESEASQVVKDDELNILFWQRACRGRKVTQLECHGGEHVQFQQLYSRIGWAKEMVEVFDTFLEVN